MLMGPTADRARIEEFPAQIQADPRTSLPTPCFHFHVSHLTIRRLECVAGTPRGSPPYCLYDGENVTIVPGGLTACPLQEGSLIVNSYSGRSKDTWVLRGRETEMLSRIANRCLAVTVHLRGPVHGAYPRREFPYAAPNNPRTGTAALGTVDRHGRGRGAFRGSTMRRTRLPCYEFSCVLPGTSSSITQCIGKAPRERANHSRHIYPRDWETSTDYILW